MSDGSMSTGFPFTLLAMSTKRPTASAEIDWGELSAGLVHPEDPFVVTSDRGPLVTGVVERTGRSVTFRLPGLLPFLVDFFQGHEDNYASR